MIIQTGIASTTHIDLHGDKFVKSALDGMALQINDHYIPLFIEHDQEQLVGVNLYGEVFELEDGEYALGVVQGIYESESDRIDFIPNSVNKISVLYAKYLDIKELQNLHTKNIKAISGREIKQKIDLAGLLEEYLNKTGVTPDGKVCIVKHFIASTGDLRIEIYSNDHNPPHFHVISKQRNLNARFDLYTFEYINDKYGKISNKDKIKIKEFLKNNKLYIEKMHNFYNLS